MNCPKMQNISHCFGVQNITLDKLLVFIEDEWNSRKKDNEEKAIVYGKFWRDFLTNGKTFDRVDLMFPTDQEMDGFLLELGDTFEMVENGIRTSCYINYKSNTVKQFVEIKCKVQYNSKTLDDDLYSDIPWSTVNFFFGRIPVKEDLKDIYISHLLEYDQIFDELKSLEEPQEEQFDDESFADQKEKKNACLEMKNKNREAKRYLENYRRNNIKKMEFEIHISEIRSKLCKADNDIYLIEEQVGLHPFSYNQNFFDIISKYIPGFIN